MGLKFEPLVENATVFPENYLPTALPLLLDYVGVEEFYPLIPVPFPVTPFAQLETVSGEALADPIVLADLMANGDSSVKSYLGPPMPSEIGPALREINIGAPFARNDVDVTIVIDAGIAFWNPRFAYAPRKNRFVDIGFAAFNTNGNAVPAVQFIGAGALKALSKKNETEGHDRGVIDALGTRFPESVYAPHAQAGQLFERDGFNHGTAMADLAAGKNPDDTSTAPVLFGIELPAAVLLDANGETLQAILPLAIHEALARVFKWAVDGENAFTPQIKIVLPYAFLGGPHDGKHPVVQNINQYAALSQHSDSTVKFFIPMGNHQQDQLHVELSDIAEGEISDPLQWFLQPDDYSSNTVEITYRGDPCQELHLTTPDGRCSAIAALGDGHFSMLTLDGTKKIGAVWTRRINDGLTRIRLSLGATAHLNKAGLQVPTGNWKIALKAVSGPLKNVQLWILREDGSRLTRRSRPARQSYFNDPAYQRNAPSGGFGKVDTPNTKIQRKGTVSVLATSTETHVNNVGAEEKTKGNSEIAWYSGQAQQGKRPDMNVLVDDGRVSRGVATLVNGSARKKRVTGTSVSAAFAAR